MLYRLGLLTGGLVALAIVSGATRTWVKHRLEAEAVWRQERLKEKADFEKFKREAEADQERRTAERRRSGKHYSYKIIPISGCISITVCTELTDPTQQKDTRP